ncbi:hypothetical protein EVAR_12748_1 [Eumeta japonica]|uniref:Uncharacterized protein n=1 Tax=Eumeta variegata TaxID=151549 RepID=A0A4C1SN80_EUMVA|nr:hypothetical protein EVAR_12748_1 [Eumeta japonica]
MATAPENLESKNMLRNLIEFLQGIQIPQDNAPIRPRSPPQENNHLVKLVPEDRKLYIIVCGGDTEKNCCNRLSLGERYLGRGYLSMPSMPGVESFSDERTNFNTHSENNASRLLVKRKEHGSNDEEVLLQEEGEVGFTLWLFH